MKNKLFPARMLVLLPAWGMGHSYRSPARGAPILIGLAGMFLFFSIPVFSQTASDPASKPLDDVVTGAAAQFNENLPADLAPKPLDDAVTDGVAQFDENLPVGPAPKPLDDAIMDAAAQLNENLPAGATASVISVDSPERSLSEYVLDGLEAALLHSGKLILVERRNLELIDQEEAFQLTGRVSDETALSIARKLGAAFIMSGSLARAGANYRLNLRALEVETARIAAVIIVPVKNDNVLAGLLSNTAVTVAHPSRPDDWKNKWLYLGARGNFSLGFYGLTDSSVRLSQELRGLGIFGGTVFASAAVFPFFALQTEATINADTFELFAGNTSPLTVSCTFLTIPLLAKAVWRPSIFMLQAYIGPYLNVPLGQPTVNESEQYQATVKANVVPGLALGGGGGIKLGPGVLFADLRNAVDLNSLTIEQHNNESTTSRRDKLTFSLGYEIGFLNK